MDEVEGGAAASDAATTEQSTEATTPAEASFSFDPNATEQPAVEQTAEVAATEGESTEEAPGPGPWQESLNQRFEDEVVRQQVDAYVREEIQPRITELEGQRAPEGATELFQDFTEAPDETFAAIAYQLYGDRFGQVVEQMLDAVSQQEQPETQQQEQPELDPRVQEMVEEREWNEYIGILREEAGKHEWLGIDAKAATDDDLDELFGPALQRTDGDLEAAVQLLQNNANRLRQGYNPAPQLPDNLQQEENQTEPDPPQTLSQTAQTAAIPTEKQGQSLDEAIADFAAELSGKHQAPPVM